MITSAIHIAPGPFSWAVTYIFAGAWVNSHCRFIHPSPLLRFLDQMAWPLKLLVWGSVFVFFFVRHFPRVLRKVRSRR